MHDRERREQIDFGPPAEVRFCVLAQEGIEEDYARSLLLRWNQKEGPYYALFVRPVSFERHARAGFQYGEILDDLERIPLREGCDRVIYFVGRHLGDAVYRVIGVIANLVGIPLLEVRGAVNETLTHGFVVAELTTPDELMGELYYGRREVTIHELYHFLGCGHSWWRMTDCYARIAELKRDQRELEANGTGSEPPFFPSRTLRTRRLFTTREQVNEALRSAGQ